MTLTVTKEKGVIIVMVTSDPRSYWPPLCQIIWNMCQPVRSSTSEDLSRPLHHRALGAVQMLVGIVGMFLVASLRGSDNSAASNMTWLGFVFITSGMVSILAEEYARMYLVFLSVVTNLLAAALALTGMGLYITDLRDILEVVLIILAVLQILVNVSTSVFAMKAMSQTKTKEKEITKEVEYYKPPLEITTTMI